MPIQQSDSARLIQQGLDQQRWMPTIVAETALVQAMWADKAIPLSNEFDFPASNPEYKAQLAAVGLSYAIYRVPIGEWDKVESIRTSKTGAVAALTKAAWTHWKWEPVVKRGALVTRMAQMRCVPLSDEFDFSSAGQAYRAQLGLHLATGQQRVFSVPVGKWDQIASTVAQAADAAPAAATPRDTPATNGQRPSAPIVIDGNGIGGVVIADADSGTVPANAQFAYFEASSDRRAQNFARRVDAATTVTGAYHHLMRNQNVSPQRQAELFVEQLRKVALDMPPVLRVAFSAERTRQIQVDSVQTFLRTFKRLMPQQKLIIQTRKIDWGVLVDDNAFGAFKKDLWVLGRAVPTGWKASQVVLQSADANAKIATYTRSAVEFEAFRSASFAIGEMVETVALRDYLFGKGSLSALRIWEVDADGEMVSRSAIVQGQRGRNQTFYQTYDRQWEQYQPVADGSIRRMIDTTVGTHPNSGKPYCIVMRDGNGKLGAPWLPAEMAVGDVFEQQASVTEYDKASGQALDSYQYAGVMRLDAQHDTYVTAAGVELSDVLELAWLPSADADPMERYFYARDVGLVGWTGPNSFGYVEQLIDPNAQPGNVRETLRFSLPDSMIIDSHADDSRRAPLGGVRDTTRHSAK